MAALYFFFNEAGLKGGLLFTHLLTPLFLAWLFITGKTALLMRFFCLLIPFDIVHLLLGVELRSFLISNLLFISTFVFVAAFSAFIRQYDLSRIMKQLLVLNFILTLVAIAVYFTPFREHMWYVNNFSQSLTNFSRLAMFTSESSYYSLLLAPVAFYYMLKLLLNDHRLPAPLIVAMIALPLLLSLSLGVMGAMAITFVLFMALNYRKIAYKRSYFTVTALTAASGISVLLFLLLFYPDNPVFVRIANIASGNDSSAQGRLSDSFRIAWLVAKEKSVWFGAGLGQVKVIAYDIVRKYFYYWGEMKVYRIPNAMAETLAIFGIFGVMLRLGLLFYLFFKTRVLSNHYRTALFIFAFIYQFTGSFITNIAEYVIWALAFSEVFPQFNVIGGRQDA